MRGKIRSVAPVKAEKRKLWRKWDQMDGQGTYNRGIKAKDRELIYGYLSMDFI